MAIPKPTRDLLRNLKQTALLLETVAGRAQTDRAHYAATDAAQTIWVAMQRIQELATAIEDMAPTFHRAPADVDIHARDLNNQ